MRTLIMLVLDVYCKCFPKRLRPEAIFHTFSSATASSAIAVSLGIQLISLLSTVALVEVESRSFKNSFVWRLVLEELGRVDRRCLMLTGRPMYCDILPMMVRWSSVMMVMPKMLGANLAKSGRMDGMEMAMMLMLHSRTLHTRGSATVSVDLVSIYPPPVLSYPGRVAHM
jgi:hypothetical protein